MSKLRKQPKATARLEARIRGWKHCASRNVGDKGAGDKRIREFGSQPGSMKKA